MYRLLTYIICLLFFSLTAFTQARFHGKVVVEGTQEPVVAASVYFNNTSIGTTTNSKGEFDLPEPGLSNAELIVSYVGFDPLVYIFKNGGNSNRMYLFELRKKEPIMEEVLVLPDASRNKYLQLFRDNFLGLTEEASMSKIENQSSLYFTKPEKGRNSFNAYSDTPLIIINKKLGYKIYFQLQEFYFNQDKNMTSFYGFTRYEELGDKKRWDKNRRKAYYGSTMHFFRSLINDKLDEESYKIFLVKQDSSLRMGKMDMAYPVTAKQILTADSMHIGEYSVSGKMKIMIQYNREPDSKAYLKKKLFVHGSLPFGVRSYLVSKDGDFMIDKNGVLLNPLSVLYDGFWVYEKAANLLPYNYDPEAKN